LSQQRQDQRDSSPSLSVREQNGTLVAAETLRSSTASSDAPTPRPEGGISIWWRVFGGTVLSILALAVVTVYQQFSSSLADVRASINHLTEKDSDLVKKDEFNNRMTSVWTSMKELQANKETVSSLKEHLLLLEQHVKDDDARKEAAHKDLDEMTAAVTSLRERAMVRDEKVKQQEEVNELLRKEVGELTAAVTALKEKNLGLEHRLQKQEECKELMRELSQLRERLAAVEGKHPPLVQPARIEHVDGED
jgi:chromosome segregation ATPase